MELDELSEQYNHKAKKKYNLSETLRVQRVENFRFGQQVIRNKSENTSSTGNRWSDERMIWIKMFFF